MAIRQHYSASNAGPVNNTSNSTWANVVTLPDFEPDASSTYALFWSSALQNATTTATDAQIRVRFGPSGFESTIATLNLESANIAEYPQLAGMFFHVEGVTPIDVYAEVSIKAETSANSINAKDGQIVALKLGANDVAAESLTRQTTTSTTPADAVTANFTSDGGDYVIIGYGEFDCPTTTVPVYIRLRCEGTNTGELGARINDATNLTPGMMVWRFTSVPSGARSAGFQYRAHTSATAGITNARILVMRAADFDAVYGAQLTSDSTGTQSDAVAITLTEALTANPHLLLGGWGTSGTTANTNITTQLTEAGSDIAESIRRTYNAAAVRFHNSAFASVRTPGSGSKTYTLDRVQAGSTSITVGTGSGLALIDLGSGGAVTHATTGVLTGQIGSMAGSAAHVAIHGTSGALTGQLGSVVGSAARKRAMASSGALTGQIGSISGAAARAAAPVTHAASGSLAGQMGSVSGSTTRYRAHPASGSLSGQLGGVTGSAARKREFGSSGSLTGAGATVAGSTARFRGFATSGALSGQIGSVSGSAERSTSTVTHATSGALGGQGAAVVGGAARFRAFEASGAIVGAGASLSGASVVAGTGIYVGARTSILVGKLTPYVGAKSF